jgi:protocatechuate 3,4-dioxygenase alpha subunit
MGRLGQTPSQTAGPYFSMRLAAEGDNVLVGDATPGERIRLEGRVLDGDRAPVEDALVEVWQANAGGRYRHPDDARGGIPLDDGFTGFGRAASDFDTGEYWFETVKPGPTPDPDGRPQAPHLNVIIQARGMLLPTFTRVYFSDEHEANATDPVLRGVAAHRRGTLVAQLVDGTDPRVYRFDIVYQGDDETVFFDF